MSFSCFLIDWSLISVSSLSSLCLYLTLKTFVYYFDNLLFSFLFASLGLWNQWVITIFYHMLGSWISQKFHNCCPFFSLIHDLLKNRVIFIKRPWSFVFGFVKMIEPSLSAMFGRFEQFATGFEINSFRHLIPLPLLLFSHGC